MRRFILLFVIMVSFIVVGCNKNQQQKKSDLLWDIKQLAKITPDYWDAGVNYSTNVKGIFFEGQIYQGNKTNIYAYIGVPSMEAPEEGFPAIVLVHGGLGKAYPEWVKLWADRGYVAIAPDFDAQMNVPESGPTTIVANPHGGPKGYGVSVQDLMGDAKDTWVYQSVSNIILANNLLRSLDIVNPSKIGITGISWGSYLLGITIGVDNRFAFAMPVYGAGFLHEDYTSSLYSMFAAMSDEMIENYIKYYDPSSYLKYNKTPTFWLQGVNDFAFSPIQKQKAVDLIKAADVQYAYWENMPHGQEHGANPKELLAYANSIVNNTAEIIMLEEVSQNERTISIKVKNNVSIKESFILWTDEYDMRNATWYRENVIIENDTIKALVPDAATYAFIKVVDIYDNIVSSKFYGDF